MHSLGSSDQIFHWSRDILMALVRRQVSTLAVRMEISRLTSGNREHVIEVSAGKIMLASPITFDLLPAWRFSTFADMLAAFDPGLTERA